LVTNKHTPKCNNRGEQFVSGFTQTQNKNCTQLDSLNRVKARHVSIRTRIQSVEEDSF